MGKQISGTIRKQLQKAKRALVSALHVVIRIFRYIDHGVRRATISLFRGLYRFRPLAFARPFIAAWGRLAAKHYRLNALLAAVLIFGTALIPVLSEYYRDQRYIVAANAQALLGTPNPNLTEKLTFDDARQIYQFNKDGQKVAPPPTGNEQADIAAMLAQQARLQQQVGGEGADDEQLYSLDLPRDLDEGITYYENVVGVSFKLVPEFKTLPAQLRDGQIIYPLNNGTGGKLVYNLSGAGLKEDVVLAGHPGTNRIEMRYQLVLSEGVEARTIPETGQIGIYTADPSLMGDMSFGTIEDQEAITEVRKGADKNHLVITIPTPSITTLDDSLNAIHNGASAYDGKLTSHFTLSSDGTSLVVVTEGFDNLTNEQYPLSIDPSVLVTSNSDFASGSDEDANLVVDDNSLTRQEPSGGVLGPWSTTSALGTARRGHASAAYNGYVYVTGGFNGTSYLNSVEYAPILPNGTLGSWATTTPLPGPGRAYHAVAAYNGHLYSVAGELNGPSNLSTTVFSVPINGDGTLGSWSTISTWPGTDRAGHSLVVYNGYLHVVGGRNNTGASVPFVQYAPILADGSIGVTGTWPISTFFTTNRAHHTTVVSNGYAYLIGGWSGSQSSPVYRQFVQHAQLYEDGTNSAWATTNGLQGTDARAHHTSVVYNGYVYNIGGYDGTVYLDDSVRFNLDADGWNATTRLIKDDTLAAARGYHTSVAYNGHVYVIGGFDGTNYLDSVEYAAIGETGELDPWNSIGSLPTPRRGHAAATYNGALFITGGVTSAGTALGDTRQANFTITNSTGAGSITAFNNRTAFSPARYGHASVAYGGYLYILGGINGSTRYNDVRYAPINDNGSIGSWTATTSFATPRNYHVAAAYKGYMYVGGGNNATNTFDDVQYAPINSDGTLGSWTSTSAHTEGARTRHAMVLNGGYMYWLGGVDTAGSPTNTVRKAAINTDGTLSSWSDVTNSTMPGAARQFVTANVFNGYMYVAGGQVGSSPSDVVIFARIGADGNLGEWKQAANGLIVARSQMPVVMHAGILYAVGGISTTGSYLASTEFARTNSGGLGSVKSITDTTSFSGSRRGHTTVATENHVYILGGVISSGGQPFTYFSDVQYAPITNEGTLGSWSATTAMPSARQSSASFIAGGRVYVLGGTDPTPLNAVISAPINANGTLGAWRDETNLPAARSAFGAGVYGDYAYAVSGNGGSGNVYTITVWYAPINSDGTLGGWTATTALPDGRNSFGFAISNGYMYVGGGGSSVGVFQRTLFFAPINGDGTVGAWARADDLPTTLNFPQINIAGGFVYLDGGWSGSSNSAAIFSASINENGTIGQWNRVQQYATARNHHQSVIARGGLYVIGGYNGESNYPTQVQVASLRLRPATSLYAKTIALSADAAFITDVSYTGSFLGYTPEITYRVGYTSGDYSSWKDASDVENPEECVAPDGIIQYVQLRVVFDDARAIAYPNTQSSRLDSLSVTYEPTLHPPTELRLRMGKWFSNNELRPYDTCQVTFTEHSGAATVARLERTQHIISADSGNTELVMAANYAIAARREGSA